jgi:hypothetical protein
MKNTFLYIILIGLITGCSNDTSDLHKSLIGHWVQKTDHKGNKADGTRHLYINTDSIIRTQDPQVELKHFKYTILSTDIESNSIRLKEITSKFEGTDKFNESLFEFSPDRKSFKLHETKDLGPFGTMPFPPRVWGFVDGKLSP